MKIIDWSTTILNSSLPDKYPEILLYLSITLSIISIVACFFLSKKLTSLKNDYAIQSEFIVKTRTKFLAIQQDISRLSRTVEPHVDNIESLQEQMGQVHELLGTVMGASDFMGSEFNSAADRVEEIRERVKRERERRRLNKVNESDFYKD